MSDSINSVEDAVPDERPIMVQGSSAPVFRGRGKDPLLCGECANTLIEAFEPNRVLSVDLECFKCRSRTRTPGWEIPGPLPQQVGAIGHAGRFFFEGTVDLAPLIPFGSSQEIARVDGLYGARKVAAEYSFSTEGLAEISTRLNVLSGGELEKALSVTRRHFDLGQSRFLDYPLAWAILHMEACLQRNRIDARTDDGAAIRFLQAAMDLVDRWGEHPVFPSIAKGLVHEFHHMSAMLIAASYLHDHGNRIGFTENTAKQGVKVPDLFIRFDTDDVMPIEVKAPRVLQWPAEPTGATIESAVETQLKRAKKQIETEGVVVIGASSRLVTPKSAHIALDSLARRAKISSKFSAVVCVCAVPAIVEGRKVETNSFVFAKLNPRYSGNQVVET